MDLGDSLFDEAVPALSPGHNADPSREGAQSSITNLKFAPAIRRKPNLLNHLRPNLLVKSVHVIVQADVHKSCNL